MACAREGKILPDELHPCFYCGVDIRVGDAVHCFDCSHLICPHCSKCGCNLSVSEQRTLEYISDKYCSDAEQVRGFSSIDRQSWMDSNIVANMESSLRRCSERMRD